MVQCRSLKQDSRFETLGHNGRRRTSDSTEHLASILEGKPIRIWSWKDGRRGLGAAMVGGILVSWKGIGIRVQSQWCWNCVETTTSCCDGVSTLDRHWAGIGPALQCYPVRVKAAEKTSSYLPVCFLPVIYQ